MSKGSDVTGVFAPEKLYWKLYVLKLNPPDIVLVLLTAT